MNGDPPPTQAFREEHGEIVKLLDAIDEMIGRLSTLTTPGQRYMMEKIVLLLGERVREHARREERDLYPLLDAVGAADILASKELTEEHRRVEQTIDALARDAAMALPDTVDFGTRAQELLTVLRAHIDREEKTLFPAIDRSTRAGRAG